MQKNAFANLIGRVYTSALRALLLPLYLQIIGVEGYGVIGFYVTLRNVLSILDFGFGATFLREMARLSATPGPESVTTQRTLMRSLEVVYWSVAIVAGAAVYALAPWIAHEWLHPQHISYDVLQRAVQLMGVATCVQFPLSLYQGGLLGLQRQVTVNVLNVVLGTLQDVGVLLVLHYVSPSITSYFAWHVGTSVLWVVAAAFVLRRAIPAGGGARFSVAALTAVWTFAVGWLGHSLASALMMQADKVVAVRFLTLQQFGYYTIAQSVAMFVITLAGPVQIAAFPRFSQLAATRDEAALEREYDRSTQLLALLVFPAAALLMAFPHDVLLLWTERADVAANAGPLVAILAFGAVLSALASMPNSALIAHGRFSSILTVSFTAGVCGIPAIILAARSFGNHGVAIVWAAQNAALLIPATLMHRRLLRGIGLRWLGRSVLVPASATAAVVLLLRPIVPLGGNRLLGIAWLGAVGLCATCAVIASSPLLRDALRVSVVRLRLAAGRAH